MYRHHEQRIVGGWGAHVLGLAQVTWTHLNHLKKHLRPKIAISENVCTGTVSTRIIEELHDEYDHEDCKCILQFNPCSNLRISIDYC